MRRQSGLASQTKSIRAGRGLGDAIYLQSIVRYFIARGQPLEVCTDWPDLFEVFNVDAPAKRPRVAITNFRRDRIDLVAHYSARRQIARTDQFTDCCLSAGIADPVEFRLEWPYSSMRREAALRTSSPILDSLPRDGRPIVLVQMPRPPFGRSDGYGLKLLPKWHVMQALIDRLSPRAFLVQIGKGDAIHPLRGIDLDLANRTSVVDLMDIAVRADGFLGYCSNIIPMAEAQSKPLLALWSSAGLASPDPVIRAIAPAKILHRAQSHWLNDDNAVDLDRTVDAFCDEIGYRAAA